MKIIGIVGSLRKESWNRKLYALAITYAAQLGATVTEAPIGDVPLYNEDLEKDLWPVPAKRFYDQIAAADAVLIVSPEYNYSIPGGLKNAIDWASVGDNAWKGKVVALMGVSGRQTGTARGQMHLRQALNGTGEVYVVPQPQVGFSKDAFKEDGTFADPFYEQRVRELLTNLLELARKLR